MRRALRSFASALAVVGLLVCRATPAGAEALPRTSSLGWVRLPGAEACIGARDLALAVEKRLGRAVFVPPAQAEVLVEGYVAPAPPLVEASPPGPPRFRAHLTLSDAHGVVLGTRDIEAPGAGCRAIEEPLALVVALLIDPDAALGPRTPVPPRPRVVVERVFVPVSPPAPAREPWRESVSLGPAVAAGLLPHLGLSLSLRGEIVPPSFFPIEIGGAVWLDARAAAPPGNRGALLSLSYGMLGLCPLVWGAGGTWVRGCAEVEVGAIRGVGYGFATSNGAGQGQVLVQAGVTGRVTRRLVGPLEIGVGLGLVVPFNPARFFYLDAAGTQQEIFHMAAVAGVVDAAVGMSFP